MSLCRSWGWSRTVVPLRTLTVWVPATSCDSGMTNVTEVADTNVVGWSRTPMTTLVMPDTNPVPVQVTVWLAAPCTPVVGEIDD